MSGITFVWTAGDVFGACALALGMLVALAALAHWAFVAARCRMRGHRWVHVSVSRPWERACTDCGKRGRR